MCAHVCERVCRRSWVGGERHGSFLNPEQSIEKAPLGLSGTTQPSWPHEFLRNSVPRAGPKWCPHQGALVSPAEALTCTYLQEASGHIQVLLREHQVVHANIQKKGWGPDIFRQGPRVPCRMRNWYTYHPVEERQVCLGSTHWEGPGTGGRGLRWEWEGETSLHRPPAPQHPGGPDVPDTKTAQVRGAGYRP